ncbi:hypothetical protein ABEF92_006347 [Exophiala dermatitidis]|nr:hypothetical protein HRR75_001349 [Exophiala dermatitidis]KAJ4559920.1 hypothetical protein HRR78_000442 [Exophiala dermatitidis]
MENSNSLEVLIAAPPAAPSVTISLPASPDSNAMLQTDDHPAEETWPFSRSLFHSWWNAEAPAFVPGRQEHARTTTDDNILGGMLRMNDMGFSMTAAEFVPGNQEHMVVLSNVNNKTHCDEYSSESLVTQRVNRGRITVSLPHVTGDHHLLVLTESGDFVPVTPRACPYEFVANDDFDAEYAFEVAKAAACMREYQQGCSMYRQGIYLPTMRNRTDTVPEVFCAIRCLARYPLLSTPAAREIPAEFTQRNRQEHLLGWLETWSQYDEYAVEEMVGHCIHHFSFFNQPVYDKSATKPATTIAVLKSSPKHFATRTDSRDLRVPITVWWASHFLDPVRYTGNPEILDTLRGTALENAVLGQCDKMYTGSGWWLYDTRWTREDDVPMLDLLTTDKYLPGHTIINGCTEGFPSSRAILSAGTEEKLQIDKARRSALQSRLAAGRVNSRLGFSCVSADELEEVPVFGSTKVVGLERRPQDDGDVQCAKPAAPAVAPPVSSMVPSSGVAPGSMSREEFHRRLAAIPLPSGGDWDDDDEDEWDPSQPQPAAPERSALDQRLETLGSLGNANWADDLDDEDYGEMLSTAPQDAQSNYGSWRERLEAPIPTALVEVIASVSKEQSATAAQATTPDVPLVPEPSTSAIEAMTATAAEEAVAVPEQLAAEPRDNGLGDDVSPASSMTAELFQPASVLPETQMLDNAYSETTASSEGAPSHTSRSASVSSATSAAPSVDPAEPKPTTDSSEPGSSSEAVDEDQDVVGVVVSDDFPVVSTESKPTQSNDAKCTTATMPEPTPADSEAHDPPAQHGISRTSVTVQPTVVCIEPADTAMAGMAVTTHPRSGSALVSLCRALAEAAAYSPIMGGGYDQWVDFFPGPEYMVAAPAGSITLPSPSTSTSSLAQTKTNKPVDAQTGNLKPQGWLKKGFRKVLKVFQRGPKN